MNVNLAAVQDALVQTHRKHATELRGKSGRNADWEQGFLDGLDFVRVFVLPAFETMEKEEAQAIEQALENEIVDLKFRHRHGLTENEE